MKRLISSEYRIEQLLNAMANGVTIQDPDGKLVFVNETAARMMNCDSPAEAVAKGGLAIVEEFEFVDDQGHEVGIHELPGRLALQGKDEPAMVVGYKSKANPDDMLWTSIKAMPIFDDDQQVILAVNVLQDITKLKQTELTLSEANARIIRLLEQTLKV